MFKALRKLLGKIKLKFKSSCCSAELEVEPNKDPNVKFEIE